MTSISKLPFNERKTIEEEKRIVAKQIVIRRSLWKKQFQTPKTAYSIRKVDVPDELLRELKVWKLACPVNEHDFVFPSPEGKISIHENVVKRYFNTALEKAKLRRVSFHSIRHSNASMSAPKASLP